MGRVIHFSDEHNPTQLFAEKLEERAQNVLDTPDQHHPFLLRTFIGDEIALTLHQIDRLRSREQEIMQSLLREECYVDTELLQMEQRTPRYSPYRFPEREKLQRRLSRIAEERRRHIIGHAEKLDGLHNRLLSLLSKHKQLKEK